MGTRKKVHAFVRVKPTDDFAHEMIKYGDDNKTINIHLKKDTRRGVVNNQQTDWSFKLDGVLHDASQDLVYETVAKDVVSQALNGYNGTIMCYGQTGAGKTYTMTGATENYKHRGILPRALQQVFKMIEERPTQAITVRVSYLEIYNESLFDLLSTLPYVGPSVTPMTIVESPQGVFIKGLSVHLTSQEEDAFSLLFEGETNRIIASHTMNKNSSRSHCIFTIYVEAHSRTLSDAKYITSKINLVDLAGSERLGKSRSEGRVLKEATYINKSLSFLEQAIIALGDQKRDHIPFRQCKLTHALKDSLEPLLKLLPLLEVPSHFPSSLNQLAESFITLKTKVEGFSGDVFPSLTEELGLCLVILVFPGFCIGPNGTVVGGNCNMILVTNIYGEASQLEETLSSLRFASRMKLVTTEPAINEKYDAEIINLRQIQEVFNQFRVVLSQQEQEVESTLRRKYTLIDKNDFEAISAVQKAGLVDDDGHLVGEPDGQGFGLGVAPFSTRPGKKSKSKKMFKEQLGSLARKEGASSPVSGKELDASTSKTQLTPSSKDGDVKDMLLQDRETSSIEPLASESPKEELRPPRPSTPPAKPVAFEDFKNERGSEINRIFKENKSILNERRKRASETTQRINAIKREIDMTKEALNFHKSLREKQGEYENKGLMIIDEEEFLLILKLKDLKKQYRTEYQDLQDLRAEIQYCQRLVDQCRHRLLMEFDIWYNESFFVPEDLQAALKPGGSIRPGMMPLSRIVSLGEDDQDRFSRLQQTMLPEGPDSVSFYNAKVKTEQKHNYLKTMMGLQQTHRK
ncbi:kinesin-like protein KIF9 isoform X2 [Globicephala melas]|uniref:kinesin-like protein KIF9 isoform X2 n=1 Tax=Globicephala melas TaxID=9731 RepID=UPI00293D50B9|nr:kinesin-like protein KIF9 isoform X2 [Globicephala melas]